MDQWKQFPPANRSQQKRRRSVQRAPDLAPSAAVRNTSRGCCGDEQLQGEGVTACEGFSADKIGRTKVSDAEYAALEPGARGESDALGVDAGEVAGADTDAGLAVPGGGAAGELVGEVVLAEVFALRALFLNLRRFPIMLFRVRRRYGRDARVDATKMQRARERLAAQKKAAR